MFENKKIDLGITPTPLQKMYSLSELYGKSITFKRDDLGTLGFGGNKLRKLEYLAFDAIQKGCDTLLTVGGVQTNHGRLTAAVAAKLGLKCILFLQGEKPDYFSGNLILDKLLGADLYFTKDLQNTIDEVVNKYTSEGHKVYTIGLGGSTPIGTMGYFSMMEELKEQLEKQEKKVNHLFVTAGSLGTLAGIILGNKYFDMGLNIHGVKVFEANPQEDIQLAVELCNEASRIFGLGVTIAPSNVHIMTEHEAYPYYLSGYNIPDERCTRIIEQVARAEAIFLDPCYTAKGFLGMTDFMKDHSEDDNYLFIHTGGNVGLWTKEHLDAMQKE